MNTYNTYDFNSDAPFIPSKCCGECNIDIDIDSLAESVNSAVSSTITEAIKDSFNSTVTDAMDDKFQETNDHIKCATQAVLNEVHEVKHVIHDCNKATEHEVGKMIKGIHHHIDEKFDEIDFLSQFDNLNNQLKNLQHE